ncbi:MAG: general secretion pathway protein GspB [Gammaproteobacteria bacterium]
MSFILDAISKSEQERQQQEVPGVQVLAVPSGDIQRPRRVLPYFIVGALLLNAALFVIWMQSGQTLPGSSSPTQIKNTDRENEQDIVSENTIPTDPTISVGIMANVTTPEVDAETDTRPSMNELLTEQHNAKPPSTDEAATGFVSGPETVQSAPATTTGEDTTAQIRVEPVQDLQDTSVMLRKVSSISELPGTVRKDLPTIIFSGHLYSSNPDSSFVFVDEGRPVRKGQQIVHELFLHEITPTGVIVEFRGYLIEVGVLQGWTLH